MVRTDTLAFPNIILLSKSYPMFWPSHLDLDNDNNGQKGENHFLVMLATSICCNLILFYHGSSFFLLEAGTVLWVMSPIQHWCKMAVTNADASPHGSLLVGPVD